MQKEEKGVEVIPHPLKIVYDRLNKHIISYHIDCVTYMNVREKYFLGNISTQI
jgi:hypothetical protein